MEKLFKRFIPRQAVYYCLYFSEFLRLPGTGQGIDDVFTRYYRNNFWSHSESLSGSGSSVYSTEFLRRKLSELLERHKIKSILDIPCGDYNWMKLVERPGVRYLGADVVKEMIEKNNREYKNNFTGFSVIDTTKGPLPKVDLILTRDCFGHFSYEAIAKAVSEIKRSESKYFLTTSFPNWGKDFDIKTGGWRPLNLSKDPFNFPEPVETILEESEMSDSVFGDKSLNLYLIKDLPSLPAGRQACYN